jgi:hypothetical protein
MEMQGNAEEPREPPRDPDAWTCSHCGQWVDRRFGVCWNCGTTCHGETDPEFSQAVDPVEPASVDEPEWSPPQFGLSTLFWLMGIVAAALSVGASMHPSMGVLVGSGLAAATLMGNALRDKHPTAARNIVAVALALLLLFILMAFNETVVPPLDRVRY